MIGLTKNGIPVIDRYRSHIHGDILDLLATVLSEYVVEGAFVIITHDFGRVVGHTTCVPTSSDDRTYLKQRPGRRGPSRFVLNREPMECSKLTFILKRIDDGYLLITAFIGDKPEPEPWDLNAFDKDPRGFSAARKASLGFWETHALIEE